MTIEAYLGAMARDLRRHGWLALRPLAEMREHLHDRTQALIGDGLSPLDAEAEALRRFGPQPELAAEISAALDQERDLVERILKIISLSTLFITLWGLSSVVLLNHEPGLLLACGLVTAVAVPTAWSAFRPQTEPATLLVCGMGCVAVGLAGVMWAVVRPGFGPMESVSMSLLMVLFVVQGALALAHAARRQRVATETVAA